MSMISVDHLTFSYPSAYDDIFEDVSFQFDTDWKLGFIGRNGRGKSTFLKLLQGEYEYSGRISSNVEFDYFPYPVEDKEQMTEDVLFEVCPVAEEWEFMREFSYLDVDPTVLWRNFSALSNGEQTKVLLAALFLNEGHYLLIDEPTNHLDVHARELVASYLKKKRGFLLVSHDRRFLDGCVDHILSINRSDITIQSGDFTTWQTQFMQRQENELAHDKKLQKDIDRLEKSAGKSASWSGKAEASKFGNGPVDRGFVGHKAAKMMKRSKSVLARKEKAIEEKSSLLKNHERTEQLKLTPKDYFANTLATVEDLSPVYDGRVICEPVRFIVEKGDRIFLDGRNGSGKSSVLKMFTGEDISHTGTLQIGSRLEISYVPQDTSNLRGRVEAFGEKHGVEMTLFMTILRKLGFERVQFEKDMSNYSAGQKKKVWIAKSLCDRSHLYIWDEPLNSIDIYSRMQIEDLIAQYQPTMILVEHDAAFRDAIATKMIQFNPIRNSEDGQED